jgi:hypothetical protein
VKGKMISTFRISNVVLNSSPRSAPAGGAFCALEHLAAPALSLFFDFKRHSEATVTYKVIFLRGRDIVGMMPWVDKERAIAHAKREFPLCQRLIGATAVEVIDVMTSEIIFALPETDDRATG